MVSHRPRRSCAGVVLRTAATLCVHFVAFAALLLVLGTIVPGYRQSFDRLGLECPRITVQVFGLSDLVVTHWYTLILAAILFDPPLVAVLAFSPRLGGWLSALWTTGILLFTILVLSLTTLAVYLPFRGHSLDAPARGSRAQIVRLESSQF